MNAPVTLDVAQLKLTLIIQLSGHSALSPCGRWLFSGFGDKPEIREGRRGGSPKTSFPKAAHGRFSVGLNRCEHADFSVAVTFALGSGIVIVEE